MENFDQVQMMPGPAIPAQAPSPDGNTNSDDNSITMTLSDAMEMAIREYEKGASTLSENMIDAILEAATDFAPARNLKAALLCRRGETKEALEILNTLIEEEPDNEEYRNNVAMVYSMSGDRDKAADAMKELLSNDEEDSKKNLSLARLYNNQGKIAEATYYAEKADKLDPDNADILSLLASLKLEAGDNSGAEVAIRRSNDLKPDDSATLNILANALWKQARNTEANVYYQQALELQPKNAVAWGNRGNCLTALGLVDEAMEAFRTALSYQPKAFFHWRNYLFSMNYTPNVTPEEIFQEHQKYGGLIEDSVPIKKRPDTNRDPKKRLKIGYCSSDFKGHSCAYFMLPLIQNHNRDEVEIYCFSDVRKEDRVTEWFKDAADHFINVVGLADSHFAEKVLELGIDILVDCVGHVGTSRMGAFAQRIAPVQVTWLGYPNTTGLTRVDYRMVDEITDPDWTEKYASETLYRIPGGFISWSPLDKDLPPVAPPPCLKNGYITFGSFNNTAKVHEGVIKVWSEIMNLVPNSRFLMKSRSLADEGNSDLIKSWFKKYGVEEDRLDLFAWMPSAMTHYALYSYMDIALDPFPYNGTTTTCEATYMGVPTVCWAGKRHAARVGASLMAHSGFPELVVETMEDYVALAVELTRDLDRLKALREETRDVFNRSPVRDAVSFAKRVEVGYRDMWTRWIDNPDEDNILTDQEQGEETEKQASAPDRIQVRTYQGYRVELPATLRSLTTNVVLEQETWFEKELPFVQRIVDAKEQVIDIGANYGLYTLAMARSVGMWGKVLCFEPSTRTASFLQSSIDLNKYDHQVTLLQMAVADQTGSAVLSNDAAELKSIEINNDRSIGEAVTLTTLDIITKEQDMKDVSFIKIDAEGAEPSIIDGGKAFFTQQSPLVMLEVKHGAQFEVTASFKLIDMGYELYCLVPGISVLRPLAIDLAKRAIAEPLDGFALNVFLCKPDRAAILEEKGFLVRERLEKADPVEGDLFKEKILETSLGKYLPDMIEEFTDTKALPEAETYKNALNHYYAALDEDRSAAQRLAHLEQACADSYKALAVHAGLPRAMTAARLLHTAGETVRALEIIKQLNDLIHQKNMALQVTEPFLSPIQRYDAASIDSDAAALRWVISAIMESKEVWSAYASYFSRSISLKFHENLIDLGYASPELVRRYQLLKVRSNKLTKIEHHPMIVGNQPGHINSDLWPINEKPNWLRFD